jgi:hypothetical protein
MTDPPRQGLGNFFHAVTDFIDERKIREQVLALVSEETRQLVARPPRGFAFVDAKAIDELEAALFELQGERTLVELGLFAGKRLGSTLIQPVLRAAFYLLGERPEAAFGNLDRFFSLVTRGISFRWKPESERSGTVEAWFNGPGAPEAAFHVLRGSLMHVYEIVGQKGEVDPPQVVEATPAGSRVLIKVHW